jgi:hypothetical protein
MAMSVKMALSLERERSSRRQNVNTDRDFSNTCSGDTAA